MIGRFINADTTDILTVSPTALTDKNLYAYCDNNPVMRVDSTGEFWNIAAGAIIGGAISAIGESINQLSAGNFKTKDGIQTALKSVGKATVAGIAGGLIGGNGMRHKSGAYYATAQNAKKTAQKAFSKTYANSSTATKMLSQVMNSVRRIGYRESWKTGWKFLAGSLNAQYLTRTRRAWL